MRRKYLRRLRRNPKSELPDFYSIDCSNTYDFPSDYSLSLFEPITLATCPAITAINSTVATRAVDREFILFFIGVLLFVFLVSLLLMHHMPSSVLSMLSSSVLSLSCSFVFCFPVLLHCTSSFACAFTYLYSFHMHFRVVPYVYNESMCILSLPTTREREMKA